jgi:hypothetical protein
LAGAAGTATSTLAASLVRAAVVAIVLRRNELAMRAVDRVGAT